MSTSSVRVSDAWMTAELLQLLQDEGMADNGGSLSARTKRTTCTRASKPDKLRQGDEDVLVDALAEFMRPASQSTIRTRHTKGSGVHSPKEHAKSHGEGLMQKQVCVCLLVCAWACQCLCLCLRLAYLVPLPEERHAYSSSRSNASVRV